MNTAQMKNCQADWKELALEFVVEAVPILEEDDSWLDPILDSGDWDNAALRKTMKGAFPKVDLSSLENGISATALGCLFGQTHAMLNKLEAAVQFITAKLASAKREAKRAIDRLKKDWKSLAPEERQRLAEIRACLDKISSLPRITKKDLMVIWECRAIYCRAIGQVLEMASREGGDDAKRFFAAYGDALANPSINDFGELCGGNRRISKVTLVLLALGKPGLAAVSTVTDLHRLLSRLLPDDLTSDENSLEWNEQHKTIEGVARELKLKFRERGRPKKKNPKTK